MTSTKGIKLDESTKQRPKQLGAARSRTPHWLMRVQRSRPYRLARAAYRGTRRGLGVLKRGIGIREEDRVLFENEYFDEELMRQIVSEGRHRQLVGELWDEMGELQFEALRAHGLRPEHRLLDLGCGCLRGGVHFVKYLAPGHYYGLDVSRSLLDAGIQEIALSGLEEKLPSWLLASAIPGVPCAAAVAIRRVHVHQCLERMVGGSYSGTR